MIRAQLFYALCATLCASTSADISDYNINPSKHAEAVFEIVSGRNSTGHWNSKLHFTHTANRGKFEQENELDAWRMKFSQKIDVIEEGELISLYAAVTIPPSNAATVETGLPIEVVAPTPNYDVVVSHRYQRVDGLGYYKFHTEPMTWYGALLKCQEETANLIVINSESEAGLVRSLYPEHPSIYGANSNDLAFVGVNDLENEGIYVSIFGESLQDTGYHKWRRNQPNNYGKEPPGEDCVAVDRDGEFYDWECYLKLAFICEKNF